MLKWKRNSLLLTTALLAFSLSAGATTMGGNTITNGDFETQDLFGWDTYGPGFVSVADPLGTGPLAVMETGYDPQSGEYITSLSQDFLLSPDALSLDFDFLFGTVGNPDPNALFTDALTVSILTDAGDLYDVVIADAFGVYTDPLATTAAWGGVPGGLSVSIDVSLLAGSNATVLFELWDEDDFTDSYVFIDNVYSGGGATPVPEPTTAALFLIGLASAGVKGLRTRRQQH